MKHENKLFTNEEDKKRIISKRIKKLTSLAESIKTLHPSPQKKLECGIFAKSGKNRSTIIRQGLAREALEKLSPSFTATALELTESASQLNLRYETHHPPEQICTHRFQRTEGL